MQVHLKPYAERRDHQQLGRHGLGPLVVAFFAAMTVFATGGEPIAPGELVAPKFEIVGGNLNFTVQPSVAGRSYLLQYADTLQGGAWQYPGSEVIGDGNNLVITTPQTAGVPRRFYRLALDTPAAPEGFSNWSANGYGLPTEAEWEKAARGGLSEKRFPWGTDTISHAEANYRATGLYPYDLSRAVGGYHPSYSVGGFPFTSPVGSFAANGYGLYDMTGNVWEWCWDWYGESTYVSGAIDPRGPESGTPRVRRGGSWYNFAINCRAALRRNDIPEYADNGFGLRLVRSSVP